MDKLLVASQGIDEAVSRSRHLRQAATQRGIDAGISALAASAGAAVVGAPVGPAAIGGIAAGAALRFIYEDLFRRQGQSRSVAAYFAQRL